MRHYIARLLNPTDTADRPPASAHLRSGIGTAALFTLTMFLSAMLLFVVQPLFARLVLPLLGGSPAVWNTAQVFFQVALLLGYLYAHALRLWLRPRAQVLVHGTLLLLPLLVLPIAVPAGWQPPTASNPIPWLLAALAVAVGLPFFVISTSSPLLQSWFSRTSHSSAHDPYFLYAASNIGSMLGLLGYPFLIEPQLRLVEQSWVWSLGYGALVALVLLCGVVVWRSSANAPSPRAAAATLPATPPLVWRRRLRWVALAAVPSSLLLSVTTYLSSNIAPFPLLWVVPLALYLLTYVLVFAKRPPLSQQVMQRVLPFVLTPLVICLAAALIDPIWLLFPLNLAAFFVATMVCHGELANDRPAATHLTEFYLWMSVGGAVGGLLTGLVAPLVFDQVLEYPLALVLLVLLLWRPDRYILRDVTLGLSVLVLSLVLIAGGVLLGVQDRTLLIVLMVGVPGLVALAFWRWPLRYAVALAGLLGLGLITQSFSTANRYTERSFFGINQVLAQDELMLLRHGTITHGAQALDPARRREPLLYYHRSGPLGQLFDAWTKPGAGQRVAVVGLGVGATTCYAQPDQQWTLYEIDPVVERIARDERFFSYLRDCAPTAPVVLGDARLKLAEAPDAAYDLIVLDAYSSDAIPIHLITREALQLYRAKLAPDGVLIFHISNRYLDLRPVLAQLAQDLGMSGLVQTYRPATGTASREHTASMWAVLTNNPADQGTLRSDPRWQPLDDGSPAPLWTDDFHSVLDVFKGGE
ncbi:MAG: fused MFS/spermidine synthase [Roseiflexaceae bacterium]|nr:fused MFS/spermidine synthase [Roseiflexaceae bacterium]